MNSPRKPVHGQSRKLIAHCYAIAVRTDFGDVPVAPVTHEKRLAAVGERNAGRRLVFESMALQVRDEFERRVAAVILRQHFNATVACVRDSQRETMQTTLASQ